MELEQRTIHLTKTRSVTNDGNLWLLIIIALLKYHNYLAVCILYDLIRFNLFPFPPSKIRIFIDLILSQVSFSQYSCR